MTLQQDFDTPRTFTEWLFYIKNGDLAWYLAAKKSEESIANAIFNWHKEEQLKKEFGNIYTKP